MKKTECKKCGHACIKWGIINGTQRYRCKGCGHTQLKEYRYPAYTKGTDRNISRLVKESSGTRSISRLLEISKNTVSNRILKIASKIQKPAIATGRTYEVDELRTYVKNKDKKRWVIYALDRKTKEVVDLKVGRRTKKHIGKVVETLLLSEAKRIYTDGLDIYRYLIPEEQHKAKAHQINHIERKNLDLRTHLKRLGRKTICYSKSLIMLEACLKIYFWG